MMTAASARNETVSDVISVGLSNSGGQLQVVLEALVANIASEIDLLIFINQNQRLFTNMCRNRET